MSLKDSKIIILFIGILTFLLVIIVTSIWFYYDEPKTLTTNINDTEENTNSISNNNEVEEITEAANEINTNNETSEENEESTIIEKPITYLTLQQVKQLNTGCNTGDGFFEKSLELNGSFIELENGRFAVVWFPENWNNLDNKKIIMTYHGGGCCAAKLFNYWKESDVNENYAIIAVQYADELLEQSPGAFERVSDSAETIYDNSLDVLKKLNVKYIIEDSIVVYHGFSGGSSLSYQLALLDYGTDGHKLFKAFIADSGGPEKSSEPQEIPDYLKDASSDAYNNAHFWMYCGEQDQKGLRCSYMEWFSSILADHGAIIDEFYKNKHGRHGFFLDQESEYKTKTLQEVFNYIESL